MNKPVAWMNKDVTSWLSCTNQHPETEIDEWLPLYTHPVKELTDEKIMDVCIDGSFYDRINDPYVKADGSYSLDKDLIDFAKAILRKAQEK